MTSTSNSGDRTKLTLWGQDETRRGKKIKPFGLSWGQCSCGGKRWDTHQIEGLGEFWNLPQLGPGWSTGLLEF